MFLKTIPSLFNLEKWLWIAPILIIVLLVLNLFVIPSSTRWSTGHYLLLTKKNNDTMAYALHGKHIVTSQIMKDMILMDSIRIDKSLVFAEYHSEPQDLKGWTYCDVLPDYAYNYCFYKAKLGSNFFELEDNELNISDDCSMVRNQYLEMDCSQEMEENLRAL